MTHFVDTPQTLCRFGICRGDITPPVGIYHRMWGAAVHDRAKGVHRPLFATATVFQQQNKSTDAESQQVMIAIDHCLLGVAEIDAMLNAVSRETTLDRACLVVVFSHTHAAGLMSLDRVSLPGGELIKQYLERLNLTVAKLVGEALQTAQPANITYGVGRCSLATNRDYWDEFRQQWVCGFNPAADGDDTMLVARVTGVEGKLLATIINYACHPTTLAWQNRLISPDFPGAMREVVEQATGATCVFVQGASGNLGPREGFVGDVEVADRNGRQLGYAALSTLESLPPPETRYAYTGAVVSGATLGTWGHVPLPDDRRIACASWRMHRQNVDLPYRADLPTLAEVENSRKELIAQERAAQAAGDHDTARDLRALVERKTRLTARLSSLPQGDTYPFEVILWRMGDAVWLAVQGEPYNLLQRSLRDRFAETPIVVATIANGWGPSYLPPRETYGRGVYQESVAVLGAGCLEQLIEQIAQRIEKALD